MVVKHDTGNTGSATSFLHELDYILQTECLNQVDMYLELLLAAYA